MAAADSERILDVLGAPTVINGVHESSYRSFQILMAVRFWLRMEVPHAVILDLINNLTSLPEGPKPLGFSPSVQVASSLDPSIPSPQATD